MKDLLEYLVRGLVSLPDKVQIDEQNEENLIIFNLTVASEDMGIIIGKSGQTIKAIRRLLVARALAENSNLKVYVNLTENPVKTA